MVSVKNNIDSEKIGAGIAQGFKNNLFGDVFSSFSSKSIQDSIIKFFKTFDWTSLGAVLGSGGGKTLSSIGNSFTIEKHTGAKVGKQFGGLLGDFSTGFGENVKLDQKAGANIGKEGSGFAASVFNGATNNFKLDQASAQKAGKEMGSAFEGLGTEFLNGVFKVGRKARDFASWEILPYVLGGSLAMTATPLIIQYIYHRAVHAIGRPKLAVRERKVTGIAHALTAPIRAIWNTVMRRTPFVAPAPIFNADLSRRIGDFANAIRNTAKRNGYFQNILFYGPGGVGKTMIAEKIAQDANVNFVMMSGGDLAQYIKRGEHITELNKLFNAAERSSKPTVIFIDEAEGLCLDRNIPQSPERIELLNTFLNRTGTQSKKFILILATNCKDKFDEAVLSRMDHKVAVALPGIQERKKIINMYLPQLFDLKTITASLSPSVVDDLALKTEGFTGRALFKMLNVMLGKKISSDKDLLTQKMIDETVADFVVQEREEAQTQSTVNTRVEAQATKVLPSAKAIPTLGLNSKNVSVAAAPAA